MGQAASSSTLSPEMIEQLVEMLPAGVKDKVSRDVLRRLPESLGLNQGEVVDLIQGLVTEPTTDRKVDASTVILKKLASKLTGVDPVALEAMIPAGSEEQFKDILRQVLNDPHPGEKLKKLLGMLPNTLSQAQRALITPTDF